MKWCSLLRKRNSFCITIVPINIIHYQLVRQFIRCNSSSSTCICYYIALPVETLAISVSRYLIRMLPLTVFRKPIKSRFVKSFLHYVPYACLTAMTFPAILYATENWISGAVGLGVGLLLAFKNKSLIIVSVASCAAVFLMEQLITFL